MVMAGGLHAASRAFARRRKMAAVTGTAGTDVASGRVQLWGYAPGANLRLAKAGMREFYARDRTATKAYANDASSRGTKEGVAEMR
jgi:hypothetical protein